MRHRVAIITAILMAMVMAGCGSSDTREVPSSVSAQTVTGGDAQETTGASAAETENRDNTSDEETSVEKTSARETSAQKKTTSEMTDSDDTDSEKRGLQDNETETDEVQSDGQNLPEPVSDDQTESETSVLDKIGNDVSRMESNDANGASADGAGEADGME